MRRSGAEVDPYSPSWIRKKMLPLRGEVWLFDLGMTAKTRPVVIVSVEYGDSDRALVTVVPHTTELRRSRFEVPFAVPFLRPGAFLVQGVSTYPKAWAIRKLGVLKPDQVEAVTKALALWLGMSPVQSPS
jgi:mRNA interferase MazF